MRRLEYFSVALVFASAVALTPVAAFAAIISNTYNFTAGDFGAGAPVNSASGSFTVAFDNAVSLTDQTAGITQNSLSIAVGSAIAFDYQKSADMLVIGGLAAGVNGVFVGTSDFFLQISSVSTNPSLFAFGYSHQGVNNFFWADAGSLTVIPAVAEEPNTQVPEPGALALFGFGLAALGLLRRRKSV